MFRQTKRKLLMGLRRKADRGRNAGLYVPEGRQSARIPALDVICGARWAHAIAECFPNVFRSIRAVAPRPLLSLKENGPYAASPSYY